MAYDIAILEYRTSFGPSGLQKYIPNIFSKMVVNICLPAFCQIFEKMDAYIVYKVPKCTF